MGTPSAVLIPAREVTKPHRGGKAHLCAHQSQHHITDHSYRAQGIWRINDDIAQTAALGLAGEEAKLTSSLPTETQAGSSPDGVSVGVRMEPALHGLAQHVPQGDLRAIGHLQGLPLSDSSQPTLRRVKTA